MNGTNWIEKTISDIRADYSRSSDVVVKHQMMICMK